MSIEKKILECSNKIRKLNPGEAFVMSFEVGFFDKTIIDASVTSVSSKKTKNTKYKCSKKSEKCYREKYVGRNKNEIRDKLCTNANLIVQGSVLATKIVKILENLKNTKNSVFSSQERTNTNVPTSGYSLKGWSSNNENIFFEYKDILSPEKKTNSPIYDNIDQIKDKIYEKRNNESELTPTTDSFYTSYDKTSKQQSNITSGSTTKTTTTTYESTESKNDSKNSSPSSTISSNIIPTVSNKHNIKPISPKLNKKIAKLVEIEEKKRKKNEAIKLKNKGLNINISKSPVLSNIKTETVLSQLDVTQKEKPDSSRINSPITTAITAISITDNSSINGSTVNKTMNVNENTCDKKVQNDSLSTVSTHTAESPTNTKVDSKISSTPTTPSVGTVTAISIKDVALDNTIPGKKIENPEISSNALQSNVSSIQTARLPPHIQNQQAQNSKPAES
uniref:VASt domain-containing protein n=1 Tax=Strongyloides stercoralis TaxID=6248 RepID=A0A0K0DW75_STRER